MQCPSHTGLHLALALCLSTACSSTIEGQPPDEELGPDASADADADVDVTPDAKPPVVEPDAQPQVDVAPCVEGDARAIDPADDTCYMLFNTPTSWTVAQAACINLGAVLVTIDSEAIQSFVGPFAAGNRPIDQPDIWMGASDQQEENSFVWTDGAPLVFNNFRDGEPNNGNGTGEEDCGIIEADTPTRTWDDRPCGTAFPYVCARTAGTASP